jgi:putative spermidine/putrescine transport system permease protein
MHSKTSDERASWGVKLGTIFTLVFLHFPLVVIIMYAFNTETSAFTFPPPGFTLDWFKVMQPTDVSFSLRELYGVPICLG